MVRPPSCAGHLTSPSTSPDSVFASGTTRGCRPARDVDSHGRCPWARMSACSARTSVDTSAEAENRRTVRCSMPRRKSRTVAATTRLHVTRFGNGHERCFVTDSQLRACEASSPLNVRADVTRPCPSVAHRRSGRCPSRQYKPPSRGRPPRGRRVSGVGARNPSWRC